MTHKETHRRRLRAAAALAVIACVTATPPTPAEPLAPPRDLHVYAYVHDDVDASDPALLDSHFAGWLEEMRRILPEREVHIHLRRAIPGITDAWYGAKSALTQWEAAVRERAPADELVRPDTPGRFNILLVGGRHVVPGAPGQALRQGASYGFASVTAGHWIAAHELGHMMNADHDLAARRQAGFIGVCSTIMWPTSGEYEPCGGFSAGNMQRIEDQRRFWDR